MNHTPLTARELEVLHQFTHGGTQAQIAGRLGITVDTVKIHSARILTKLGARNRAHAVATGYRAGLLGAHADARYDGAGVGR
jgi:DNA-binding CsgD family transcriptional regulator